MIAVNIQGGLGNQLFEYAFAYAAAKKLHTCFVLDNTLSFKVSKYFCTSRWFMWIDRIPYVRRIYRERIQKIKQNKYIDYLDCWEEQNPKLRDNTYYDGYFQSIACFEPYEKEIHRLFRIRRKYKREFADRYGDLFKKNKTIVMHVRRGDYLTHGQGKNLGADDVSLPIEYYKQALNIISQLEQYKIIVVGDDLEWEKQQFSHLPNVLFAHNSAIIDFQFMMNADVVICSNGTFAWWAAYLNSKDHKRIIAPKYFLGYHIQTEFPKGVYNKTKFEQIEVV